MFTWIVSPALGQTTESNSSQSFEQAVDLSAFGAVAIHSQGRVKSFDSFASSFMAAIAGSRQIDGQSDAFTYFDLMLRPGLYGDRPTIFIKMKQIRVQFIQALQAAGAAQVLPDFEEQMKRFMKDGLIAPSLLMSEPVQLVLQKLRTDLMRTATKVEEIETAIRLTDSGLLRRNLTLMPPLHGSFDDPWMTLDDLGMHANHQHEGGEQEAELIRELSTQWEAMTLAWQMGNASGVNAAVARIATLLPQVNPGIYPAQSRLEWESWYFNSKNMTWVWIIYLFCIIPLLATLAYRWPGARWLGLALFLIAFSLHTFAVMLRWYVADRWPNTNMFEAVTTAAWFGGCFAVLMELVVRKSPMRNLFVLGSASASMVALMAARFLPLQLNPGINNMMPVLHDIWLYIHTNIIIFSYCLIFLASVTGGLYLLRRGVMFIKGHNGVAEFAKVGGAGSLLMTRPDGTSYLKSEKTTFGQVLDGSTMILMELSFILLWTGLVMGAIWADHSWGRPWGWDPKEVFALNTFLIFALLIHVRLKVKDKGLWTAILACIGCVVMLFNWIIINFAIAGLHSYA
ncbi:MAG: cytochrome c biogenesis protein CcsA [Planctomycetota bacterium]|nr:cytochrome c biogenesis protein CcsA [Planctomycetota bacterium]